MTNVQRVQKSGRAYEGLMLRKPPSRWCAGAPTFGAPGPWHPGPSSAMNARRTSGVRRTLASIPIRGPVAEFEAAARGDRALEQTLHGIAAERWGRSARHAPLDVPGAGR